MSDVVEKMPFLLTPGIDDRPLAYLTQADRCSPEELSAVMTTLEQIVLLHINNKTSLTCAGNIIK